MSVDPYWDNVVLLLPMEGVNGSTTFTDLSTSTKTITPNGNAQISTAQSKWGSGSGYFDGSGDYLSTPNHEDFTLGVGEFTIECWIYLNNAIGNNVWHGVISNFAGDFFGWSISVNDIAGTDRLTFTYTLGDDGSSSGTSNVFRNTSWAANTWYHIAISRVGLTGYFCINGSVTEHALNSRPFNSSNTDLTIGQRNGTNYFPGYIQDVRITKGVARYTGNFTPPSEPFPTTNGLGSISGTVYEKNTSGVYVPGAYPVRVYKRSDGSLVASTTSAEDGTYSVAGLDTETEYYVVALDTAATWQSPGLAEQVFPS